jgi:uncharacterized RmlC-like cupin family protein
MPGFVLRPGEGPAYGFHGAGPGRFVFVPRDSPHSFTVSSTGPATALVITGPSRLDRQIAERGELPPAVGK